ncbi:MAG: biotin/lipoyl-binding protein, partial [Campylobacterota bacterium]
MGKIRRSFTPTPSSYDNLAHSNAFVSKLLLYLIAASVIIFFIWAATTRVEEIARGEGVVIPSGQNKVVQNLEGGVIANIAVSEGDIVKKGDILLQISNQDSQSKAAATQTQKLSLEAKKMRLQAQAASKEFAITKNYDATLNHFLEAQKSLYNKRIQALESKISALKQQYREKKAEKKDAKQQIKHMQSSIELLNKEIAMLQPLVQGGIK